MSRRLVGPKNWMANWNEDEANDGEPMKPNVLWIYGEDLYPNLACYGTPVVQTPVIDNFASEGTLFTNAFVSCPVCS